ncbi:hypothetical protein [Pontibacter pudoricolor]|uniref:hypothetical protein n=1 Tax=Pontibacter pudoricolor TaxID=2694930 RepID=UPI001390DB93|nr:hypothetical protein [Pontibacter pudoricolor]
MPPGSLQDDKKENEITLSLKGWGMTIANYKTITSTIAAAEKLPALDYREAISKVASVALRGRGG